MFNSLEGPVAHSDFNRGHFYILFPLPQGMDPFRLVLFVIPGRLYQGRIIYTARGHHDPHLHP